MTKRLISLDAAAKYFSMGKKSFERVCPVRPVNLPIRKKLYDVRALDDWADALAGRKTEPLSPGSAYDEGKRRHSAA